MRKDWNKCKKKLAILWFVGGGILFFIIFIQTLFGHYESEVKEAWEWTFPTILPNLSLIIGVLVMDSMKKEGKKKTIDGFLFNLSFILSIVYILTVLLTIILEPFSSLKTVELMKLSNLWLGPFQGLVSASLGAFFIRVKDDKS
jgi:hypothetical protein